MKKLLSITIAAIIGLSAASYAAGSSALSSAIQKYKSKNYVGCIQDTMDLTKKDPSNAVAYYYMAISYARIGNRDKALDAYQKVIDLSTNTTLVEYAQKGTTCINDPEACKANEASATNKIESELDKFIRSGSSYSNEVKQKLQEIRTEQMKNNINTDADQNIRSEMPTNDEIAEAVKTLAKAGFNPFQMNAANPVMQAQQALYQNPEYAQLQMLLGNNNTSSNGDFMNMLPYFLAQKQNSSQNPNISADMFKNMMMSSMVGNLSTTFDVDNKY